MAFAMLIAQCAACEALIMCNPELVPSIRVNGVREPLCESCVRRWEAVHKKKAVIPKGAYEPMEC